MIPPSTLICLWLVSAEWAIAHKVSCIFTYKMLPNTGSLFEEAEFAMENGDFQKQNNLMDGYFGPGIISS